MLALGKMGELQPNKSGCELLLSRLKLKDWALGKTKVNEVFTCFCNKNIHYIKINLKICLFVLLVQKREREPQIFN